MRNIVLKYYPQLLLAILAFSFFTRFYRLNVPEKYIFDEVYHAVTAKLISRNDVRAYEWINPPPEPDTAIDWLHPPLAKYTQAISMKLFGETSFGWRFSSALFGVIAIFVTARLAYNIFKSKSISILAAFIASLDGLLLTMSRIAMNDIHVTVFILMALNLYTIYLNSKRKKLKYFIAAALFAGLAMGTKWSGLFSLLIIGYLETINLLKTFFSNISKKVLFTKIKFLFKSLFSMVLILIILPSTIYLLSYAHMFILGKDLHHFSEMHQITWRYQTTLDATHPAQSTPFQWFINAKPVWFSVNYNGNNGASRADIYAFGNPMLFWFGGVLIFTSVAYVVYFFTSMIWTNGWKKFISKKTKFKKEFTQIAYLLFIYFAVWLPWQLSPRIMFFYHYLPAVPLLSINMAYWINRLIKEEKSHKALALFILFSIIVAFIIWFPHWTEISMPIKFKNSVYFALPSWKQD